MKTPLGDAKEARWGKGCPGGKLLAEDPPRTAGRPLPPSYRLGLFSRHPPLLATLPPPGEGKRGGGGDWRGSGDFG
jgi:hypothetical protein